MTTQVSIEDENTIKWLRQAYKPSEINKEDLLKIATSSTNPKVLKVLFESGNDGGNNPTGRLIEAADIKEVCQALTNNPNTPEEVRIKLKLPRQRLNAEPEKLKYRYIPPANTTFKYDGTNLNDVLEYSGNWNTMLVHQINIKDVDSIEKLKKNIQNAYLDSRIAAPRSQIVKEFNRQKEVLLNAIDKGLITKERFAVNLPKFQIMKVDKNYTHFAVSKVDGKIISGWDYKGYNLEDLRQFSKDYFFNDLINMNVNPKEFTIFAAKTLEKRGVNPFDWSSWRKQHVEVKKQYVPTVKTKVDAAKKNNKGRGIK